MHVFLPFFTASFGIVVGIGAGLLLCGFVYGVVQSILEKLGVL